MAKYLDESGVRTLWSKIKAKLSNKMDKNPQTINSAQGEWFSSTPNGIEIGSSGYPLKLYSSIQPEWWKNGVKQGTVAMKEDLTFELRNGNELYITKK